MFKLIQIGLLLLLSACSNQVEQFLAPVEQVSYHYKAVGYASIAIQKGDSYEQKLLNAIKVSKIDAYEELTAHIHGVFIRANADIKDHKLSQDEIYAQTKGVVKEASVIKAFQQQDIYITVLQVKLNVSGLNKQPDNSEHSKVNGYKVQGNQVYY